MSTKWTSEAGPIQTKKVEKAISGLRWRGATYRELSGVIGVSEHESCYTQMFGGSSQASVDAHNAIGEQFGWTITRANYTAIIAAFEAATKGLELPVKDSRKTPEEHAETIRLNREYQERIDADLAKRKAEYAAAAAEKADGPVSTVEKHYHTKRGCDFWLVVLADRVGSDEFDNIRRKCKYAGGKYSRKWGSTPGGFAFDTEVKANAFSSKLNEEAGVCV